MKKNIQIPKVIYAVSMRLGAQSNVVAAVAQLKMYEKSIAENTTVNEILSNDSRVDLEFKKQFSNAILSSEETSIIVVKENKILSIMSNGIIINKEMDKYLERMNVKFGNTLSPVREAVVRSISYDSVVYIISSI